MAVGGAAHTLLKPGTGLEQLGRALEMLALAQPGQVSALMHLANAVAGELSSGSSVVIVSSSPVGEVAIAANVIQTAGGMPVPIILEESSFKGAPPARGDLETYVIHKGDELERRLDHRVHGPGNSEFPTTRIAWS
jgi:hypothetical protein